MNEPNIIYFEQPRSVQLAAKLARSKDKREKDRLIREYASALSEDVRKKAEEIFMKIKKGA